MYCKGSSTEPCVDGAKSRVKVLCHDGKKTRWVSTKNDLWKSSLRHKYLVWVPWLNLLIISIILVSPFQIPTTLLFPCTWPCKQSHFLSHVMQLQRMSDMSASRRAWMKRTILTTNGIQYYNRKGSSGVGWRLHLYLNNRDQVSPTCNGNG